MIQKIKKIIYTIFNTNCLGIIPWFIVITILASVIVLKGAFFHPELNGFLKNYLRPRPFLVRIFENEGHHTGAHNAREFSLLVDLIDAHFIFAGMKLGLIHFYGISHYFSLILICIYIPRIAVNFFGQPSKKLANWIMLLFLTTPAVIIGGYKFRSAKILVTLGIVLLLHEILRFIKFPKRTFKSLLVIFIIGFLMAISDLQGAFYLLAFSALGFFFLIIYRSLKSLYIFTTLTASSLFYLAYREYLAPLLIQKISGQYPEKMVTANLLNTIGTVFYFKEQTIQFISYQFSYLFGNVGWDWGLKIGILIFILTLLLLLHEMIKGIKRKNLTLITNSLMLLAVPFLVIASIDMIGSMMLWSTQFLTWPDLRSVYYNLTTLICILLLVQLFFAKFVKVIPQGIWFSEAIISIFIIFNVITLPGHLMMYYNGHLARHVKETPYLRQCINERYIKETRFTPYLSQHGDEVCVFVRSLLGENIDLTQNKSIQKCKYQWLINLLDGKQSIPFE